MRKQFYTSSTNTSYIHVFGHRNPDSDSICCSIVVSEWLNFIGKTAKPFRQGELTPESKYILNFADVLVPDMLPSDLSGQKVWLVDFTDVEQGPPTLLDSDILGIIDHHRLGTVITKSPPDVWIRKVGCSCTIVFQILTTESPMPISQHQAILLLGAILSDTLALTGPTTTEKDKVAVSKLKNIANLNYDKFINGLLAAKTDISGQTASQLLNRDAKNYQIGGLSILLSQIEVCSMADITPILPELFQAIEIRRKVSRLDVVVLILTDIMQHNSTIYFSENETLGLSPVSLPGVTSRKKEILPWLTNQLEPIC